MWEKGQREKGEMCERELSHRDVFNFFRGLKGRPQNSAGKGFPSRVPSRLRKNTETRSFWLYKVVWYSYSITLLGSKKIQFQKQKSTDEQN